MEVDNDIDSQLLQQFSSMGTNDREVLIAEFQRLLGDQLNPAGCAFYLDMNNWNLQAAICSYYDLEQPQIKLPGMSFVKDVTIGEGESIPPNTHFVKTWRIQNSGDEVWPPGCCLRYVSGAQFGHKDRAMVQAIQPGAVTDVSVEMVSPSDTGLYQGRWRMSTATGSFFGEFIWVILNVEENGLMGVTQQLSQFGSEISHQSPQSSVPQNPFASPMKEQSGHCVTPFPSPVSNVPVGNGSADSSISQAILGSPMGSDIAQHGSFPSSPCVQGNGGHEMIQGRPRDGVCTALFQTHCQENTFNTSTVIPGPEVRQHGQCEVSTQKEQFNNYSDNEEMS